VIVFSSTVRFRLLGPAIRPNYAIKATVVEYLASNLATRLVALYLIDMPCGR
jgi:hypothetical protein